MSFKKIIAHAVEKRIALFYGEQLYIKTTDEAEVGDIVVFAGDFLGNGEYITSGKAYPVVLWQRQPAFYDDMQDMIKVYEPKRRTAEHVSVFRIGSIERVFKNERGWSSCGLYKVTGA